MPIDIDAGLGEATANTPIKTDTKAGKEKKDLQDVRYSLDTKLRVGLAIWAAVVVSCWLVFVLIIIANNNSFNLSDTVASVLLGTTTLNVIGLMVIVLNGLFPKPDKSS